MIRYLEISKSLAVTRALTRVNSWRIDVSQGSAEDLDAVSAIVLY